MVAGASRAGKDGRVKLLLRSPLFLIGLALGIICLLGAFGWARWWRHRPEVRYDRYILAAAERYHIDPALVKAVIWRESRFHARARGGAGEIGLMQVNKLAAQEWADASQLKFFHHHQLFDPEKNIMAGSWYLAKLLRRYPQTDNPIPYALADYNAGRSNVLKWLKGDAARVSRQFMLQIEFPGTRDYVYAILKKYNYYKTRFPGERK